MQAPQFKNTRIAITGATGFVGYHVARLLVESGASVTAVIRPSSKTDRLHALGISTVLANLNDPTSVSNAVKGCENVIHAAGAVDFGDDWERFREVNVGGTVGVIEGARKAGVKRVVHVSSIVAVGGSDQPAILDESHEWNLGRFHVPYATTKREAEVTALEQASKNLEVVVVNPGCVIGPDDFSESEFGYLCRRFWRGKLPIAFTGGNNFVDVRDVADGIVRAAAFGRSGERYLLTGENKRLTAFFTELATVSNRRHPRVTLPACLATPIAAIAERFVKKKSGKRPVLTCSQARLLGQYFFFTNEKARRELGFAPRPLSDTVRDAHRFWMAKSA